MKPHLLIMRFSAMGDVAMIVPIVASLARQYPNIQITVLSRPFAKSFFEGLAPNINFIGADFKKEYQGIRGLNLLFRQLQAKQFTAVADLHDVLRTRYLRYRFRISQIATAHIDKHRHERHQLVQHGAGEGMLLRKDDKTCPSQPQHFLPSVFNNYTDVLVRLGYKIKLDFTQISTISSEITSKINQQKTLEHSTLPQKKNGEAWIGIAPFAAHRGKILPLSTMDKIIQSLDKRPFTRIMLFSGGKEEREKVAKWCKKYPNCIDVSSAASSLKEELYIMQQLNVMLSMDSANQHLASLVATPVVSIWGATHTSAGFLGWNQLTTDTVSLPLQCRPCSIYGNKTCKFRDYICLRGISADDVISKIEKYL